MNKLQSHTELIVILYQAYMHSEANFWSEIVLKFVFYVFATGNLLDVVTPCCTTTCRSWVEGGTKGYHGWYHRVDSFNP